MIKGLLLLDKPAGISSFWPIPRLRRLSGQTRVGHAGTLDPFATGLMVYLLGRDYTRLAERFLQHDKVYLAQFTLGITTDSYDLTGEVVGRSSQIPTLAQLEQSLTLFQGEIWQLPPMFSAKKQQGRRLYELARKGEQVERKPCLVRTQLELLDYRYPDLELRISCSKGTYVRSLAYDLGQALGCGAHVSSLRRLSSGPFQIEEAISAAVLDQGSGLAGYVREYESISIAQLKVREELAERGADL